VSAPFVVSIPHRLGRQEAARRLTSGLAQARADFARFISIDEEVWDGDRLSFRVRAMGQTANGTIDVADDHVHLQVTLPWLLGKVVERFAPTIQAEGRLMLERK
jgi:hypothetical protein